VLSIDAGTDRCAAPLATVLSAHLDQSSAICNSVVAISADFTEETEDWTVSEIAYDQQFSVA